MPLKFRRDTHVGGRNGLLQSMRRTSNADNDEEDGGAQVLQGGNKMLRLFVRGAIGVALFLVVLACLTFSKLSLLRITNELRHLTVNKTENELEDRGVRGDIARVYWQLVFIMVLPQCLTFLRSAAVGVIGKTREAYPWPGRRAMIAGVFSSLLEVVAVSVFVFSVLCYLTPEIALVSTQSIFIVQFVWDVYYVPFRCKSRCRAQQQTTEYSSGYHNMDNGVELRDQNAESDTVQGESRLDRWRRKSRQFFRVLLENKQTRIIAVLLQLVGVAGLLAVLVVETNYTYDIFLVPVIGLPLSIFTLSFLWSNKVQEYLVQSEKSDDRFNARYKANFLNSLYRIVLYPLVTFAVFYAIHHAKEINPWTDSYHHFLGSGTQLSYFLAQISTSFFGYLFAWVACTMTIRAVGFAFPLLLSTPVALLIAVVSPFLEGVTIEHFIRDNHERYTAPCLVAIYVGQVLGMGYFICTKKNLIMSQDKDMFLNPHYDGVFLEQYLALNRQVRKYESTTNPREGDQLNEPRAIFICSTMYHENVREMRQMLKSIYRMAEWYAAQARGTGNRSEDLIESHVFFDGAINGGQLTQYALQLLSLIEDCLGVCFKECIRVEQLYGQSMSWDVGERDMKFTVHFKDNFKVKNKKRWSQVMYMNYVINYRIHASKGTAKPLNKTNTFILTTDADIDFTAESAVVLLDTLASNEEVGAVCARTHPKGSGPVCWYQIFDYAIGHWLLKPAEHLFGCVLCCPGCFSVFRCKALDMVLKEYSSEVQGAADFLTKDMGEDRWLCTLLIQKGWRLDYCSISEDHTYCPETFEEFYKQRRRWVPSTLANLLLLISKAVKITKNNNSVSILFVLFQAILAFSTAISPATVILIIASGLQGAYQISTGAVLATIIILSFLSVFYGIICLYTSQKTQIDLAKFLTFIFAIVMAVVFAGIFKQIIYEIFPVSNGLRLLEPPICSNSSTAFSDCVIARNNLEVAQNMSSPFRSVRLPTSPTTWYAALFTFSFLVTAILHFGEFMCLVHGVWYMLALPSGYLLLLIYSAANLDSQSWGTREGAAKAGGGFAMTKAWTRDCLHTMRGFVLFCCGKKADESEKKQRVPLLEEEGKSSDKEETIIYPIVEVQHNRMDKDATEWLQKHECIEEQKTFEEHGYWNLSYIASMRKKDFKAIGIQKQGFVLRLEKAAKKLPAMVIETDVPQDVTIWLEKLGMEEYTEVFHRAGYKTEDDVENLKELNEKELKRMGIVKMAHVQRLKLALESLFHPTCVEVQIYKVKKAVNRILAASSTEEERKFWDKHLSAELKPVTVRLQQTSKEIGRKLKDLRNATLALILLVNIMWIILLYTVTFPQLVKYNLPEKAFQLLFLAVYGIIIVVSFFAMLAHRFVTLMHFLGRPEVVRDAIQPEHEEPIVVTSRT